ncbi:hypothetical protein [Microbacterium azadirachtae]|uniref:Uncharacterized protein n=1 Tax=Microbacterium azadirachtae TaxID=582680 RepID=A0A0F0KDT1_9MICO|nr:hypothetical protein [Microbacterium azadirachtae]KJL19018.1 hypothetical protein RL72_03492 [Microbacterium azadirachtae]UXW87449.1 hypothetical protein NFX31_08035 [Microbacterium azadirachtae]SDL22657.1 hypothetical protein SAMN04488593_0371 [Microbacterium azadirachtae]SEF52536.1 hypothetical protein SAMN04488594_0361 [Microbacterium azadirachtae]SEF52697.1 hypothetical protein SAMN04488592_0370 [Microbacterium azadirachtae]
MNDNDHLVNARTSRTITRRTIIKGAAWSVPVIAAASTLPQAAASGPCPCAASTPLLMDSGSWPGGMKQDGNFGGGPFLFADQSPLNPGQLEALPDRVGITMLYQYFWISTPIEVCAGRTYTWTYEVQGSRGDSAAGGGGAEQFMDVGWSTTANTNALDYAWTNSFYSRTTSTRHAGAVQVTSPTAPGPGGYYGFGGVLGASYTATSTFVAPITGTVYLKVRWTGVLGNGVNNDDYGIVSLGLACA